MIEENPKVEQAPNYTEFSDPRLVALYDTLNALGTDAEFMCEQAEKLKAHSIIDLGCGTGLLTSELAKRGHEVVGIEPASAMLDVAKHKSGSDKVKWIQGSYEKMDGLQTDLVLMTSHVAQFFLEDEKFQEMLKATHKALNHGGHLVFDSRNPATKPWGKWTREMSSRKRETPSGQVEMWYQLLEVKGNRVLYEIHYLFDKTGEELVSINELVYRSQDEINKSLSGAGFIVENIYGDWDSRPFEIESPEMIFVAKR